MKLKQLAANMTEIEHSNSFVLFSYETPVAVMVKATGEVFKTATKFSRTTSKHINKWLDGQAAKEIPQYEIEGWVL